MTAAPAPQRQAHLNQRQRLYLYLSVALFIPLFMWFYLPADTTVDVTGHQLGRDFINMWVGPRLAFGGELATLFDLDAYHHAVERQYGHALPFTNWSYPLFVLPLLWPLAQLPYWAALGLWTALGFLAFAAVTVAPLPRERRWTATLLLLLAPASLINIVGGQNGFVSAALMIGGVMALDRRPALAGVMIGLLAFKPHIGALMFVALMALGAWRAFAIAALTATVLVVLSIMLFGIEPWRAYFEAAGGYLSMNLERFHGFFTFMMASVLAGSRKLGFSHQAATAIQAVISIVTLAVALWTVRQTPCRVRRTFVLIAAMPLAAPYVFNYDLTGVAAMAVWRLCGLLPALTSTQSRWRAIDAAAWMAAWIAPTAMMYLNIVGLGIAPVAHLALFAVAVRMATASRTESEGATAGSRSPAMAAAAS